MNCRELDSFIDPFLDGEFELTERAQVEHHLTECDACARKVSSESRLRDALRRRLQEVSKGSRHQAPASLRSRIQGQVRAEQRRAARRPLARGAAAVALMASAVVFTVWFQRHRERLAFLEDAALRHSRGLPLEIQATSPEQVEAWFVGKLDHRVAVPRFTKVRLQGARLSNVKDRPAAHLTYVPSETPTPRRVGLFVYDDAEGALPVAGISEPEIGKLRGYNTATWREGEIVYQLVTDLDEQDILQMLQAGEAPSPSKSPPSELMPGTSVLPASLQQ